MDSAATRRQPPHPWETARSRPCAAAPHAFFSAGPVVRVRSVGMRELRPFLRHGRSFAALDFRDRAAEVARAETLDQRAVRRRADTARATPSTCDDRALELHARRHRRRHCAAARDSRWNDIQYVAIITTLMASAAISRSIARIASGTRNPPHNSITACLLAPQQLGEAQRELAVARRDLVEVAIEEAVFPHPLEQQMQEQPQVLDVRRARRRSGEQRRDATRRARRTARR